MGRKSKAGSGIEAGASAPVAAVARLLDDALDQGASDVHLDPTPDGLAVRIRRDGALRPGTTLARSDSAQIVGRIKALAALLAYRTDVPQDGVLSHRRGAETVEVRVATYPTACGERIALRFPQRAAVPLLRDLGIAEDTRGHLEDALAHPDGVLLLTGPSGSGKTTTLYSALQHIAQGGHLRSMVSVEDPIERSLAGVVQTQVDPRVGLTTARALRSLLRQDPDVLLIGEIRDRETAATALEAGLTGHLVASTVHAGTAPLVFARLLDMGMEPFVLTSVVRGVLAQRLLRRRCGNDSQPCTGARTCRCEGTGLRGRCVLDQWLAMTPALRRAILDRADGEALTAAAVAGGMPTLRERGDALVRAGTTTPDEVDRVLGTS